MYLTHRWVFKTMWEKGLVYQGFKVMPFSTGCCTPLSNFEVQQNYKETVDPTGAFPLTLEMPRTKRVKMVLTRPPFL